MRLKVLMRLKYESLEQHADIVNEHGRFYNNAAGFALNKYAYYVCYKCSQSYYGGEAVSPVYGAKNFDPSELLCPSCSPIRVDDCPKHGKDYNEFKCATAAPSQSGSALEPRASASRVTTTTAS